jgi:histidine triad (HIT) family protein
MTEDSVFTKIIKGELTAHKIYEDELTIAIMPLHPTALCHVLVIPKLQVEQFFELPVKEYQALMLSVQKVAKRIEEVIKPHRVGLKVEGLDVNHAHIHVLAFDNSEQFKETEDLNAEVDNQKLAEMAQKLAF